MMAIHFPDAASSQLKSSSLRKAGSESRVSSQTLGFDWSLVCYMVNVSASDIPTSKVGSCDIPLGVFQGSVPPGGMLSLNVPSGSSRLVDVLVFLRSSSTDACPALDSKSGFSKLSRTRFIRVGQTASVDMTQASVTVVVDISTPADGVNLVTQYGLPNSCKPTAQPQGSFTSRLTSGHGVLSGTSGSMTIKAVSSVGGQQSEAIITGDGITMHLSRQAN